MNQRDDNVKRAAKEFAARLKKMRERQDLTQAEVGGRSGLTPSAISQLESGDREASFSTIVRLAHSLGTTPNDLMGLEDIDQLDPSLQPLYRKLKELSARDVQTVDAFVRFLEQKDEREERE